MKRRPSPSPRGMALIEVVVSMIVLSVMLVAALNAVGASRVGQLWNADHVRGLALASDLMAEILDKSYADPNEIPVLFGPEASELLAGRTAYDDVDDYAGYQESPPKDRTGAAMSGLSGWKREVDVQLVALADLTKTSALDVGYKRVTVTVRRGTRIVAKLTAVRTAAAPN